MKKIDFSKLGGMPLTQNRLDYMQQAYNEQISALAQALLQSNTTTLAPVVLWGMKDIVGTLNHVVTAGAFYYNGEIITFSGGSYPFLLAGQSLTLVITQNNTALSTPYNNGSTPMVLQEKVATLLVVNTSTPPTTAATFPWSAFLPLGNVLAGGRPTGFVTVNAGFFSGGLSYKKNPLPNTLHIKGSITVAAGSTAAPPQYYNMFNLPSNVSPGADVPFAAFYRYHTVATTESTNKDYLRQINCELTTSGQLNMGLLASTADYTVYWNTIIPLD